MSKKNKDILVKAMVVGVPTYKLIFENILSPTIDLVKKRHEVSLDFRVDFYESARDAWQKLNISSQDIYFIDGAVDCPIRSNIRLSEAIRERFTNVPLIGMSYVGRIFVKDPESKIFDSIYMTTDFDEYALMRVLEESALIPPAVNLERWERDELIEEKIDRFKWDPIAGKFMEDGW